MRSDSHAGLTRIESRLDALLDGSKGVRLSVMDDVIRNMYPESVGFSLSGDGIGGRCTAHLRRSQSDGNKFIVVLDYGGFGERQYFKCITAALAFFDACRVVDGRDGVDATLALGPGGDEYTISANMPNRISANVWIIGNLPLPTSKKATTFTVGRTLYRFADDMR
jgi:hypothetical protein